MAGVYMPTWVRDVRHMMLSANPQYKKFRPLSQIKIIACHYDEVFRPGGEYDAVARQQGIARYHISKDWGADPKRPVYGFGIMYHLSIGGDGTVLWLNPFELITWQARNANPWAIGVKMDLGLDHGHFQSPTPAQVESFERVLHWLCYERPDFPATRENVWGHGEMGGVYGGGPNYGNATQCPGGLLPYVKAFRAGLKLTPTTAANVGGRNAE